MYYFAYIDENNIVTGVYEVPSDLSSVPGYISITEAQYTVSKNDLPGSIIGKRYNSETGDFEDAVYYYAIIDARGVCTEVVQSSTVQTGDDLIEITAEQYANLSVVNMWWNGTAFVPQPPHIAAAHSTDDINVGTSDVWLSDKLDDMDADISGKADSDHTHTGYVTEDTYTSGMAGKANASHTHSQSDITGLSTALDGKANASHTHDVATATSAGFMSASDKVTLDSLTAGTAAMPPADILTAIKTVDGASSGLDADLLDGKHASEFATSDHTHTGYASSATVTALTETVNGKADANHTHTEYAAVSHTHTASEVGAASSDHTHTPSSIGAASADHTHTLASIGAATADHTHTGYVTETTYTAGMAGKADATHTHTGYAASSHTHAQADITGLETALSGKASTDHTHTGYATIEALSEVQTAVNGKADANHTHTGYAADSHTHSMDDVTGLANALSGKASTDHTHSGYAASSHNHSMDDITGLSNALSGKASTDHTHSGYASSTHTHTPSSIGAASASHTHSDYLSTSGGTVSGTLNVNAAIKSNGVQVGYNSGTDTTLGSNSYATIVAGTQVTLNGTKAYAPNIYPRNTGSFDLGAQSNRWSNIYSKTALNVSSDERLKEGIEDFDGKSLTDFIKNLNVVKYKYIGEDTERIGLIAQQVIKADPEIAKYIVTEGDDGYLGLRPADLVYALIAAVQNLQKQIDELKK